jgi:hypothetical protein
VVRVVVDTAIAVSRRGYRFSRNSLSGGRVVMEDVERKKVGLVLLRVPLVVAATLISFLIIGVLIYKSS